MCWHEDCSGARPKMSSKIAVALSLALFACSSTVDGTAPGPNDGAPTTTSTASTEPAEPPAVAARGERCACYSEYASGELPSTKDCCEDGLECLIDGMIPAHTCNRDENWCVRRGYCMERKTSAGSCSCGGCPSGYVCRGVDSTCRCMLP